MADRPIIFSGPMVRAILDGRKTQTRRVLKDQPGERDRAFKMDDGSWHQSAHDGTWMTPLKVPYAAGDRLWVREAWKPHSIYADRRPSDIPPSTIFYAADEKYAPSNTPWRPSIYMPRWASRLTLTVTDVRVQRLQDISPGDAKAEGVASQLVDHGGVGPEGSYRDNFRKLWNELNEKRGYGWDVNPWVVAITFTAEQRNIDA